MHDSAPRSMRPLAAAAVVGLALVAGASAAWAGVNFWTPLGPDGGYVVALATSPRQPLLLFAASSESGLFRSMDGGGSWIRVSRGLDPLVTALAVDPQSPATVYVASLSGVAKSTDAGESWGPPTGPAGAEALVVDPQSPSTLYAAQSGVSKSTDGGASWRPLPPVGSGFGFQALAIDPARPGTIYAASWFPSLSVLRSTDGGATWSEQDAGLPHLTPIPSFPVQLAVDPTTVPSTLYAAFVMVNGSTPQTFRSTDGGDSWHPSGPGGYPLAVGQGVVYAGAFKSADDGVTWTPAASPPGQELVLAAQPGSATIVYAGTTQGVWMSGDAAAGWQAASAGLTATRPQSLAIDPLHPRVLYAGVVDGVAGSGLFKSVNSGRSWQAMGPPWLLDYLYNLVVDPVTPSTLYAASGKGLAKSTDSGATWEVLQQGNGAGGCFQVSHLAIDPRQPETLYAAVFYNGGCGGRFCPALKSNDGGVSFSCLGLSIEDVSAIFVAPSAPSTLYALGQARVQRHEVVGVWKSADGGTTWKESDAGLYGGGGTFYTMAIDPTDANRVFVISAKGVFRTTDGGRTWSEFDHKLPLAPSSSRWNALAIDPQVPTTVFVGGSFGVYRSVNSGLTWYPVNGGLPDFFGPLLLNPKLPNKLYAGTFASGIYTYTLQ